MLRPGDVWPFAGSTAVVQGRNLTSWTGSDSNGPVEVSLAACRLIWVWPWPWWSMYRYSWLASLLMAIGCLVGTTMAMDKPVYWDSIVSSLCWKRTVMKQVCARLQFNVNLGRKRDQALNHLLQYDSQLSKLFTSELAATLQTTRNAHHCCAASLCDMRVEWVEPHLQHGWSAPLAAD